MSGELWRHIATTLGRLIASFLMAVIPGTALGLAMGWWLEMRLAADPLVRLLFPIPSIAFFPVVIFYLGLSEWGLLLTAAITPFLLIAVQAAAVESLSERCWKQAEIMARAAAAIPAGYSAGGAAASLYRVPPRSGSRIHRHRGRRNGAANTVWAVFFGIRGRSCASKRCTLD
jgi:hypothetical protein